MDDALETLGSFPAVGKHGDESVEMTLHRSRTFHMLRKKVFPSDISFDVSLPSPVLQVYCPSPILGGETTKGCREGTKLAPNAKMRVFPPTLHLTCKIHI